MRFVEGAYRSGTQKVYNSKWSRWITWCSAKSVDPIKPRNVDLVNFLAHLVAQEGLSPSSIKVFRSAIVTSLKQLGGRVRGESAHPHLVRDVVRGIEASAASNPRRVPLWDLVLVLGVLREPPYEPLRSLDRKTLTLKTAFLLMLASGRRASEVNSLSGLPADVCREADGTYLLKFLPEFRAKNQTASDRSPVVRIPPLSSILGPDDDDVSLCPVRCLKRYLRVVSVRRPTTCRKLLLSVNPNYDRDVSTTTVSRWVSEVVRHAYQLRGASLESARAHELRAWSASMALHQSVALTDILQAAYWKSDSTFIHFYLRDASVQKADGSSGIIPPMVVAQRAVPGSH